MVRRDCDWCDEYRNCIRYYSVHDFLGWACSDCYERFEYADSPPEEKPP